MALLDEESLWNVTGLGCFSWASGRRVVKREEVTEEHFHKCGHSVVLEEHFHKCDHSAVEVEVVGMKGERREMDWCSSSDVAWHVGMSS